MDLKEDLDVFNFTNDNGLAIPSSHLLGLVDEKEKNKKVEELMAEIKVLKEEEIVNLKKELDREKNDFQCYREIKENEKEAFIKEKEELLKILIEKDSLINQKEAFINEKEAFIREKEALIKEIDSFIKEKDSIIIEKDSLINEKDSIIKLKDSIIIEKEVLIKEKEFFIKDLQSKTDSFDNNLQELKTSHETALQSLQNSSKPSNEIPLIELEQEKLRLEQLIDSNKRSFLEEKSIFENELKITEKEAVEAKMKYAQVSMDKEYYQMKYHQLVKEIQKRNITDIIF